MAEFAVQLRDSWAKRPEDVYKAGDVVAVKDDDEIFYNWANVLLRGTSIMTMMPFSVRLYEKYFERIMSVKQPNGQIFRKKISCSGVTCRQMTARAPLGVQYYDVPKMKLTSVAREVLEGELREAMPLEMLGTHAFSDGKSVMETWLWGRREMVNNLLVWVPDGELGEMIKSKEKGKEHPPSPLRGATPFKGGIRELKCQRREDKPGFKRRVRIDWKKHGKALGLETRINDMIKNGYKSAGRYLLKLGLDPEMTLLEVAHHRQVPLPNRFFVNPGAEVIDGD